MPQLEDINMLPYIIVYIPVILALQVIALVFWWQAKGGFIL